MRDIEEIIQALVAFRDQRDWAQFHDARNLALAISIEAAELNELFLWKRDDEAAEIDRARVEEELADIFAFAFLLAEQQGLNVKTIVLNKIRQNAAKYPVEKARGVATKYNELGT